MSTRLLCLTGVASVLAALQVCLAAEMRSSSFVVPASSLNAGGLSDSDAAGGLSLGQSSPIGLGTSATGDRLHSAGFWPAAGGPISPAACVGDCSGDHTVTVDELVRGVNIALGSLSVDDCSSMDPGVDGMVTVDELIRAVGNALDGCSAAPQLLLPLRGASAVPLAFNLQGRLSGAPDSSATADVEVGIWDRSTGGARLYYERHYAAPLANGLFNLLIGGGANRTGALDADLFAGDERWMELTVDGETLPFRQPLVATAYVMRADTAARAATADSLVGFEGDQPISSAGGTFTGPITFAGTGGGSNVRIASMPGRPDHGVVAVGDAGGNDLAAMFVDAAGQGKLVVQDSAGRELASVGSEAVDGQLRGRASTEARAGRIVVRGPNGEVNAQLRSARSDPNHGSVTVNDAESVERAEIMVDTNGGGRLRVYGNGGGRPVRSELIGNDGIVQVFDSAGATAVATMTSVGKEEGNPAAENRGMVLVRGGGLLPSVVASISVGPREEGIARASGPNKTVNVEIGASQKDANKGRLSIYDERGVEKAVAGVGADGAGSVAVADQQGRVRATLDGIGFVTAQSADSSQGSFLGFTADSPDHGRIGIGDVETGTFTELSVDAAGQGQLRVNGLSGAKAAAMRVFPEPDLGLIETRGPNGNGNVVLSALTSDANSGFVAVKDAGGENRAQLFADVDGRGRVSVLDENTRTRAQFQVSQGTGLVETRGPNGEENVVLSAGQLNPDFGFASVYNDAGEIRGQMHFVSAGSLDSARIDLFGPSGFATVTASTSSSGGEIGVRPGSPLGASMSAYGTGVVSADLKNFVVDHPAVSGSKIVYTAVEGPEAAMYHRGVARLTDGRGEITLPEHFLALASPGTMTVQLTPGSARSKGVGFGAIESGRIEIGELHGGTGSYDVYFVVHAVRRGHEDYEPVIDAEAAEASRAMRSPDAAASAQIEAGADGDGSIDEPEGLADDGDPGPTHGGES